MYMLDAITCICYFVGTTPYSDGFSQSGASNYFPPPPVEGDDDDSWLEEQDVSTALGNAVFYLKSPTFSNV